MTIPLLHDDVIKWKHFPRYWPFVRGIHRWPVNSPHKGQWREALMFSLIYAWINSWVNNREAGDLRCHHANYYITLMIPGCLKVKDKTSLSVNIIFRGHVFLLISIKSVAGLVTLVNAILTLQVGIDIRYVTTITTIKTSFKWMLLSTPFPQYFRNT